MGIVNRTPDSFFDGGSFLDDTAARAQVDAMVRDGADIVDVGAESTRPGASAISAAEQIDRIGDAISWVIAAGAIASVDTTLPAVAEDAVRKGARIINSVSLETAEDLARVALHGDADLVLTHCRGSMTSMPGFSVYDDDAYGDVVADVAREWGAARDRATAAGLPRERIVLDPGLGFAKNAAQSLALCARLGELKALGHRVLVGTSRKSFLARTVADELGAMSSARESDGSLVPLLPPAERLAATIAATLDCARRGADIVRVHDVKPIREALAYTFAVDASAEHFSQGVSHDGGEACSRD